LADDPEQALTHLRRALDLGFYDHQFANHPDLASLHGDPEFESMVSELEERLSRIPLD